MVTLDIIKDKSSMTQVDAAGYKSEKAKRGPFDKQDWRRVCSSKLIEYRVVHQVAYKLLLASKQNFHHSTVTKEQVAQVYVNKK